jgi:Leucine-rich repeat (LRR) protein
MIRTLLALARAARDPALQDPSVSNVKDEDLDEAARRSSAPAKADLTTLPITSLFLEMSTTDQDALREEEESEKGWETVSEESELSNADVATLRAIRAASPALQEWWPEGESPRSFRGVTWSDDRVQKLSFYGSGLEVLAPQIGQLQALTHLDLQGCPLKELPPQVGQLQALTDLRLWDCEQLTLAPGARVGQPEQTTVAAYAPLLIVEPHKDTPGELHAFLLANPLAVPAFFKSIVGDLTGEAITDWLGEAIKATPELAHLTAPDGRSITDVSEQARLSRLTAKPDEEALRALRAASPALQEWWPECESPRSWQGVMWSDDRVQKLRLDGSELEVLAPQIGQLQALTWLDLSHCRLLKELPPQVGQLLALTNFYIYYGFEQLTLAPGAEVGQQAQATVAAYARLLIVEPRKDAPGQLHAFLLANPLAVPAFFKYIVGDLTGESITDWLDEAIKATPELAHLTGPDGRSISDVAEQVQLSRATAKPDEDALWAMRAASPALQKRWPECGSPRSWKDVTWSDDRVQVLDLQHSGLEVLAPQVGQLQALTNLNLCGCPLKELPPQIGQLQALTDLDLRGCEQLTLAPGAETVGQPAQTTVAAYAGLRIVEPLKDAPGQLHAFLLAKPQWVPAFFKSILTDAAHADWLGKAVKATHSLAHLTAADGRRAIDVAVPACKQAMQAAFFLLGRFDVDAGPLLHRSATAAVAAAADHGDPEAKPLPRVALKVTRSVEQVCAELKGRVGLALGHVVAVKAVYADKEAVGDAAWKKVKEAADELGIKAESTLGLSSLIQTRLFPSNKQEMDQASATTAAPGAAGRELKRGLSVGNLEASSEYKLLIVLELADKDGTAVWTILKETEVTTQLEERTKERRQEERRRDDLFSAQARAHSGTRGAEWKEGVGGEDSDQLQQVLVASNEMQLQMNQMQKDLAALNEGPAVTCTCSIL